MFAASSLVWSPLLGFAWPALGSETPLVASREFRFSGRLLCGSSTRFSYDSDGNLHYQAVGIELHDEPCPGGPCTLDQNAREPSSNETKAGIPSSPPPGHLQETIPLATVHYLEYSEADGWCRYLQGVSVGGRVREEGSEMHVSIPVDMFAVESPEPNIQQGGTQVVDADETYVGTREVHFRIEPGGPLLYGPCRTPWRGPHSHFNIQAFGAFQPLQRLDLQIDGEPHPVLHEGVAGGFLLVGVGSVEELTWFKVGSGRWKTTVL